MIPSTIRITTSGTATNRRDPSAMIGARTAASPMSTSVGMALLIMCRSLAFVTARCGTPRHLPAPRYALRPCIRVISKV